MIFNKIKKLLNILKDKNFISALLKGSAAGTEHLTVFGDSDFNYIVDVGANRGQFALIARKLFPSAVIHSFEPLDEPAQIFNEVFKEDKNIELHRCAIGCDNKSVTIHVSERDDSSSLLPISKTQSDLFPNTEESETRTTEVHTLDKVLDISEMGESSLLKIDVQGYELEVLKGCKADLNKFKSIYVECSFIELYEGQAFADEVINLLQKNNFVLSGVYNVHYDQYGKAIQADFLFARN